MDGAALLGLERAELKVELKWSLPKFGKLWTLLEAEKQRGRGGGGVGEAFRSLAEQLARQAALQEEQLVRQAALQEEQLVRQAALDATLLRHLDLLRHSLPEPIPVEGRGTFSSTSAGAFNRFERKCTVENAAIRLPGARPLSTAHAEAAEARDAVDELASGDQPEEAYYEPIVKAINEVCAVRRDTNLVVAVDAHRSRIAPGADRETDISVRCVAQASDDAASEAARLGPQATLFVVEVRQKGDVGLTPAHKGQLLTQLQDVLQGRPGSTFAWGFLTDGQFGFAAKLTVVHNGRDRLELSELVPFSSMLQLMRENAQKRATEMLRAWGVEMRFYSASKLLKQSIGARIGAGGCGWVHSLRDNQCVKIFKPGYEHGAAEVGTHARLLELEAPVVALHAVITDGELVEDAARLEDPIGFVMDRLRPIRWEDLGPTKKAWVGEASSALTALHNTGYALLDIDLASFQTDQEGAVWLVDLGGAVPLGGAPRLSKAKFWPSPEQFKGVEQGELEVFVSEASRRLDFMILANALLTSRGLLSRESQVVCGLVQALYQSDDDQAAAIFRQQIERVL